MKTYKQILLQGAKITWQKKYLWFFGVFAVLFSATGYEALIGSDIKEKSNFLSSLWQMDLFSIANWGKRFIEDPLVTIMIIVFWLFVLLMFLFVIWLSNVSRIAIVKNVYRIKQEESNNLEMGIKSGIKYFWPVLFLNFVFIAFVSVVVTVIYSPLILIGNEALSFMFFSVVFVFLILFILILSFIVKFATAFIVIKGNKIKDAIINAFKLFFSNWLVSLEMAFILFFINIAAAIVLFISVATFGLPSLWLIDFVGNSMPAFAFWMFVSVMVFIFGFVLLFGTMFSTFQISTWTSLYLELITEGKKSKLVSMFSRRKK